MGVTAGVIAGVIGFLLSFIGAAGAAGLVNQAQYGLAAQDQINMSGMEGGILNVGVQLHWGDLRHRRRFDWWLGGSSNL